MSKEYSRVLLIPRLETMINRLSLVIISNVAMIISDVIKKILFSDRISSKNILLIDLG